MQVVEGNLTCCIEGNRPAALLGMKKAALVGSPFSISIMQHHSFSSGGQFLAVAPLGLSP